MIRVVRSELVRLFRPRLLLGWFGLTALFAVMVNMIMFSVATQQSSAPNGPGVGFPRRNWLVRRRRRRGAGRRSIHVRCRDPVLLGHRGRQRLLRPAYPPARLRPAPSLEARRGQGDRPRARDGHRGHCRAHLCASCFPPSGRHCCRHQYRRLGQRTGVGHHLGVAQRLCRDDRLGCHRPHPGVVSRSSAVAISIGVGYVLVVESVIGLPGHPNWLLGSTMQALAAGGNRRLAY